MISAGSARSSARELAATERAKTNPVCSASAWRWSTSPIPLIGEIGPKAAPL